MGTDTGESPEVWGPARLAYTGQRDPISNKVKRQGIFPGGFGVHMLAIA